jgi:hypothetical protein
MHQTSLRELTTLGMKNAENLAIPSVRNDVSTYNTRILGVSIAWGERNDLYTTTFFFFITFWLVICSKFITADKFRVGNGVSSVHKTNLQCIHGATFSKLHSRQSLT